MLQIQERVVDRGPRSGTGPRVILLPAALAGILVTHNPYTAHLIAGFATNPDERVWAGAQRAPVRAENPALAALVRAGLERSPTFRELYVAIAQRNGIVHVMWDWNLSAAHVGAVPNHMTRTLDGTSYVRVLLRRATSEDALIATIAHELRHVIEMLDGIITPAAPVSETGAAIETGAAVRRELVAARRSGHAPFLCSSHLTRRNWRPS